MRKVCCQSLVVAMAMLTFAACAQAADKEGEKESQQIEKVVVPADGVTEFVLNGRSAHFRLAVYTIAGGTIGEPKITGSAKLVRAAEIVTVDEEGHPSIGAINREYVFRSTGAGKVVIEFKKTLPTEPMPVVEKFTITIK